MGFGAPVHRRMIDPDNGAGNGPAALGGDAFCKRVREASVGLVAMVAEDDGVGDEEIAGAQRMV